MAKLLRPLSVPVWDSKRVLPFKDTSQISTWATREREFWAVSESGMEQSLRNVHQTQVNYFQNILSWIGQIDGYAVNAPTDANALQQQRNVENTLESQLSSITGGTVLTTECKQHKEMSRLKATDPSAFVLLAAASRSNARDVYGSINVQEAIAATIRNSLVFRSATDEDVFAAHRDELATLKTAYETQIDALNGEVETIQQAREETARAETEAASARSTEWRTQIDDVDAQWKKALRVYDEEMALQAPATYWRSRANWSIVQASIYAVAFAAAVTTALIYFFADAVPYLHDMAKPGVSIVTASLPVLVPTFAIVWVLRIIGRLLSESLQLIRDGRERETMVKTFLALMNDETRGKALVTDDDRLLILHALFRPSSISANDDSPPVHWFDILTRKYGTK